MKANACGLDIDRAADRSTSRWSGDGQPDAGSDGVRRRDTELKRPQIEGDDDAFGDGDNRVDDAVVVADRRVDDANLGLMLWRFTIEKGDAKGSAVNISIEVKVLSLLAIAAPALRPQEANPRRRGTRRGCLLMFPEAECGQELTS